MTPTHLVDAHAHVFDEAGRERRTPDDLAPADRKALLHDLWRAAEPVGVRSAVLVPLGMDDTTAAAALAAHPGRCVGVAVAGKQDLGAAAPLRLRRRREAYPFDAVRLMWLGEPGRPLDESPAWPLLRAIAEQDLVLWTYLGPEQAPFLPELVRLLPSVRVVLNHLGFAPVDMSVDEHRRPRFPGALDTVTVERVLTLADHPGIHLMVSGHYALTDDEFPYADLAEPTRRLVGAFGAGRCLWGSDFPWPAAVPGYAATLTAVQQMLKGLTPAELDLIFAGTARRLFPHALDEEI